MRRVARALGSFIEQRWLLLLLAAAVVTGVATFRIVLPPTNA